MNESMDRVFADWLREGPETGPGAGLAGALDATRRTDQRPGWTFPERWLPMQLTMTRTPSLRPLLTIIVLAMLIATLVATALFAASQRRQPLPPFGPARNGAVVYTQDGDLFIADELGGTPRSLTAGPDADSNPVFSPQGDRIAFVRSGPDLVRIMTVSPDGSDVRELARDILATRLDWSPDGSALIASGWGHGEGILEQVLVIRSDGSGSRTVDVPSGWANEARWRPDGRHIAIEGEDHGNPGKVLRLYLTDADGTNLRELIGLNAGNPEWSPDGKHLAFMSAEDQGGDLGISIADISEDGALTALRRLRPDPESSHEMWPKWSPDGTQLAFLLTKGSREQIGVVHADGSGFRVVWPDVPDIPNTEGYFWSPDGRWLAITEVAAEEDPSTGQIIRGATRTWSMDVATGQQTEAQTPVETWQRLAP
jgi:Tol biopolymer transport system component